MTKYVEQAAALQKQYNALKEYFQRLISKTSVYLEKGDALSKMGTEKVSDELNTKIKELKLIKNKLSSLRLEADKRGLGVFKQGNVKKSIDSILNVEDVKSLKEEFELFRFKLARLDLDIIRKYVDDYEKSHFPAEVVLKNNSPN